MYQYKYSIPIVVVWLFCRRDLPFILRSQHEKGCTLSHLLSKIEKGALISPPLRLLFMLFKCLHSDLEQNDICIIIGTLIRISRDSSYCFQPSLVLCQAWKLIVLIVNFQATIVFADCSSRQLAIALIAMADKLQSIALQVPTLNIIIYSLALHLLLSLHLAEKPSNAKGNSSSFFSSLLSNASCICSALYYYFFGAQQ